MAGSTQVYLETGKRWVFAAAVDWPGWCRRGLGEEAALEALMDYAPRYAAVAGRSFDPGRLAVIARLEGSPTTDFGAPCAIGPFDAAPVGAPAPVRERRLLEAAWAAFDEGVATSPATLRKGPRGGGRDRDAIRDHVREAERAYGRKVGVRVPPRTPWDGQRAELLAGLGEGHEGAGWPARYALRRIAWHVLDHLWEIEDRRDS